jgi:hypothetical protein
MADAMIDTSTGTLRFDDAELVGGPGLSRSAFDAHPDASRFEPLVVNPPYVSFHASLVLDGTSFAVVLFFEGERLTRVSMTTDGDRSDHDDWFERRFGGGTSWGGAEFGGIERVFPWGVAGSHRHPQDGVPVIVVQSDAPQDDG